MKEKTVGAPAPVITMIELSKLVGRPNNRKVGGMPAESMDELTGSIREKGILQPLIVRWLPSDLYEIVAGERRATAASRAGLAFVPCQVFTITDDEADEIAVIDNLQRAELHPMDEANAYAGIYAKVVHDEDPAAAMEVVASKVGKGARYVAQRMQLVHLVESARALWRTNPDVTLGHALLLSRLPAHVQEIVVTGVKNDHWALREGLKGFQQWIEREVYMELSKASWKKEDATLVPAAGACVTCKKRTGANATLFPEISKKDVCLDGACFLQKAAAMVERSQERLEGKPHLIVSEKYHDAPKDALTAYGWEKCKKADPDALECVVVDGLDQGRVVWGRKLLGRGTGGRTVLTEAEKKKRKSERAEEQLKVAIRLAVYRAVVEAAAKIIPSGMSTGLPLELFREIAGNVFDREYARVLLLKVEDWTDTTRPPTYGPQGRALFREMTEAQLILSMVKCRIADGLSPQSNAHGLYDVAKLLAVDVAKIEKTVRAQAAEAAQKVAKPKLVNTSPDGIRMAKERQARKDAKAAAKKKAAGDGDYIDMLDTPKRKAVRAEGGI